MRALVATILLLVGLLAVSAPASAAPDNCVTVIDQPDNRLRYCYVLNDPDCLVYETRTTFIGTETRCAVGRPV